MTPTLLLAALLLSPAMVAPVTLAPAPPAAAASEDETPAFQRFVVDSRQSEVGFDGTSTLHDFVGRSRSLIGELHADPARLSSTAGGQLLVAGMTLDTDSEGRDEEMHETLEVNRYPNIVLTVDGLSGSLESWRGELTAQVTFDIHGIRRSHTLPVTLSPMGRQGFLVAGELEFSIEDHDLDPPGFLFVSMDEQIKVWFDVALRPVTAKEIEAQRSSISWVELTQPSEGAAVTTKHEDLLWIHNDDLIWDRTERASWLQRTSTGTVVIDLSEASRRSAGPTAEASFAGMHLASTPAPAAAATQDKEQPPRPPTGEASVLREGDEIEITVAGQVWARLSGLQGEAPFGALLGEIPGVPESVRAALANLSGLPERFFLRTLTPEGTSRRQGQLGEISDATTPDWYWEPTSWTTPSTLTSAKAAKR